MRLSELYSVESLTARSCYTAVQVSACTTPSSERDCMSIDGSECHRAQRPMRVDRELHRLESEVAVIPLCSKLSAIDCVGRISSEPDSSADRAADRAVRL